MADRKVYVEVEFDDKGAKAKAVELDKAIDKVGKTASSTATGGISRLEQAYQRATSATLGGFSGVNRLYQATQQYANGAVRAAQSTATYTNNLGGLGSTSNTTSIGIGKLTGAFTAGQLAADAIAFGIQGVWTAIRFGAGVISQAIDASVKYTNAFVGLNSITTAFGQDAEKAKQAAVSLSRDGLMTVAESAEGLKNLIATGFELPQAIRLMDAFKDSAAFGRQGQLEFGAAIVGATQGIKNQMSQMVDNAGVTKNLTNILQEQGFKVSDLSRVTTDARVRMALYNGILKETSAQTGDANRLADTYSGTMSRLKATYEAALATWGAAITENKTVAEALKLVTTWLQNVNSDLSNNGKAWVFVSNLVIGFIQSIASLLRALDSAQLAFHGVKVGIETLAQAIANLIAWLLKAIIAFNDFTKFVNPSAWLPVNQQAAEDAKKFLADVGDAYNELGRRIEADTKRSIEWGNTLQTQAANLDAVAVSLKKTVGQAIEFGKGQGRIQQGTKETNKELDKLLTKTRDLEKELKAAKGWMTQSQLLQEYGTKVKAAIIDLKNASQQVPQTFIDISNAVDQLELDKMNADLAKGKAAWSDMTSILEGRTQPIIDKMLARLPNVTEQMVIFANLETEAAKRTRDLNQAAGDAAFEGLAEMFATLGQIQGGLGDFMAGIGQVVVGLKRAREWANTTGKDGVTKLGGNFGSLSVAMNKNATGAQRWAAGMESAANIAQGAMDVWSVTDDHASAWGNAGAGALAGAKAGAAFGPYGIAIGAAAGLVVGLIRGKPEWAKAADEVGRDFGTKISKGLAEQIAKDAKTLFRKDRFAASIFNLSGIIEEAGGLNPRNLDRMTGRLRDVFVMLQTGQFNAAQATQVLQENWQQFAEAGTDANGRLSDGLREIIRLTRAGGLEVQAITEYVKQQSSAVVELSNTIAASIPAAWAEVARRVQDARTALDTAMQGTDVAAQQAAQAELTEATRLQSLAAEQAKTELQDLAFIAVNAYAAAVAAGHTHAEALRMASPGVTTLTEAYRNLGLEVENEAFRVLSLQNQLLTNQPNLIAGVDALAGSFTALGNVSGLTEESFRALERQGHRMYTRIQGEVERLGGTTRDALMPMQNFLHQAMEEARRLGIPLDENTQSLIDQSRELGVWQEVGPNAMEKMTAATETLAGVMERLVSALTNIGPTAEEQARRLENAMQNATNSINTAENSVDGLNYGHSPGGLDDISMLARRGAEDIDRLMMRTGQLESRFAQLTPFTAQIPVSDRNMASANAAGETTVIVLPVVVAESDVSPEEIGNLVAAKLPGKIARNEHGLRVIITDAVTSAVRSTQRT